MARTSKAITVGLCAGRTQLMAMAMAGVMLIATGAAVAVPDHVPFRRAWDGPIYMHLHDLGQGNVYTGFLADGVTPAAEGVWLAPNTLEKIAGNALNDDEDGWNIYQIDVIYEGAVVGPNVIVPQNLANPLFLTGDQNAEVVGATWNRDDLWVRFKADGSQDFEFTSDTIDMFVQPVGTFDDGAAGSSGRILNDNGTPADPTDDFYEDKYVSIGYDASGNLLPNSTMNLTGATQPGYWGHDDLTEGIANFLPMAGNTGTGHTDFFLSWLPGTTDFPTWGHGPGALALEGIHNPQKADPPGLPDYDTADLRLHTTNAPVTHVGSYDWLIQSSDPATGHHTIPEPLTLIGFFAGVCGLGQYIRRRARS